MNNKYLIAWVIPLLLLGSSCKKQDKLGQEESEKKIKKVDLIGKWVPSKIETIIVDKDGTKIITDSSEYVKFYVPGYLINSDQLVYNNNGSSYKISQFNNHHFFEYEIYGITQKLDLLRLTNHVMILQHNGFMGTIKKTETIYFNKSK